MTKLKSFGNFTVIIPKLNTRIWRMIEKSLVLNIKRLLSNEPVAKYSPFSENETVHAHEGDKL